ncbi:hypothetical protein NBH19_16920 [Rhizobium sp. S95]|uniref:Plasmid mobilization relaxosome protein MobC n=1 Tax=Ciceribacter sichuanensis TaxID=2949647 RepID=A0AAJ1C1I0_9HYPH|nr:MULTISPECIES: hypothetical protein [unclassified Ciceribacter]MCM2397756.1 hypothetical protein [Ciceribacter sp. S95]MCO5960087.1 hypothetical protein [Ciceribacter sp. S101]
MVDISKPQTARPKQRKPETKNFCLRLTDDEKRLLLERAGKVPLGTFIRNVLLGTEVQTKRRTSRKPAMDETALARVLAALGSSRLSSNLNQLAKAVNIGALPVTPETEREIADACKAVVGMRRDLLLALGLTGGERP